VTRRRALRPEPLTTYDLPGVRPPRDRAGWWALCGFLAGLGTGALAAAGVILR